MPSDSLIPGRRKKAAEKVFLRFSYRPGSDVTRIKLLHRQVAARTPPHAGKAPLLESAEKTQCGSAQKSPRYPA